MDPQSPAQPGKQTPADGPGTGHDAAVALPPSVPDYALIRRIGGGSYGDVWLARSTTGVLRAVKIVWRHTFEDERPFKREFEGIQRFERISREHPSQLALFHIGRNEAEGCFYYVMELADAVELGGEDRRLKIEDSKESERASPHPPSSILDLQNYAPHTLRAELAQGRLPAVRVLEIGLSLAEALGHLHQRGLVHRDVKPSNVIFVNGRPKLADIGLVTDASDQCSIVGTEGYLPPEGPGTPQADIFALGKVLYEAATGLDRRDFPKLPEDLRAWPDAKQVFELNEIFLKACASDSRQRYTTAEAMLDELALLHRGKSIKRKRAQEWYWAAGKRIAVALTAVSVLMTTAVVLRRVATSTDLDPDGWPSTNFLAIADCDKGMAIIRNDNFKQLAEAYAFFTNAIHLDPHYARPYMGLLEMAVRDAGTLWGPKEAEAIRREAEAKLKLLQPELGATYTAQAINSFYDWDFATAKRYAELAVKASPNYELGHTWYAFMLSRWQRPAEAREQLTISERLARSKAVVYVCFGHTYYAQREFTTARDYYQKAVDVGGRQPAEFNWLARAQRALGDYRSSIENMKQGELLVSINVSATTQKFETLLQAFEANGTNGYWQLAWERYAGRTNDFVGKAYVQVHLGETDEALDLLEQAFAHQEGRGGDGGLLNLLFDESWDSLRDEPRFKAILDEIGFTKVMPERKQ